MKSNNEYIMTEWFHPLCQIHHLFFAECQFFKISMFQKICCERCNYNFYDTKLISQDLRFRLDFSGLLTGFLLIGSSFNSFNESRNLIMKPFFLPMSSSKIFLNLPSSSPTMYSKLSYPSSKNFLVKLVNEAFSNNFPMASSFTLCLLIDKGGNKWGSESQK